MERIETAAKKHHRQDLQSLYQAVEVAGVRAILTLAPEGPTIDGYWSP